MHCHEHGEAQRELWSPPGVRTGQNKFPSLIRTLCYVQQLTCTQGIVIFLFSEHHSTKGMQSCIATSMERPSVNCGVHRV